MLKQSFVYVIKNDIRVLILQRTLLTKNKSRLKMRKRVADIIVDILIRNNIDICFSVVGGGSMHLNNAFVLNDKIEKIYNHHEQACSMAAESYARASGRMASVCVTSGPGGTNAINGVQGAWVDSIPMIVISGHPRYETTKRASGLDIRCRGVQENDIISQVKGITKYAKLITDPLEIKREMQVAVNLAMEGRRGPVWLDIPLDVQGTIVDEEDLYPCIERNPNVYQNLRSDIKELEAAIKDAKRPCILTGSGIRTSDSINMFREFISKVKIPIVGGCIQPDICYNGQDMYYGMSGNVGPRAGNFILQNADLILVLGNSLSYKQTGFNQEKFAPNADIFMVDIQSDEAKKPGLHVKKCISVDLKEFFSVSCEVIEKIEVSQEWNNYCIKVNEKFKPFEMLERYGELKDNESVPALYWWKKLLSNSKEDAVFALGNSSCIYGILQEGINFKEQRVLVNYNCGSMGHDLPNAIGSALAFRKDIICVTGDGSIMMNLQELQTIKHYNLPVKIVLFSNNGYGAIRNTCTNFFNGKYTGCDSDSGISFPTFKGIAEAFGFNYRCCNNVGEVDSAIDWLYNQESFCFLEIKERIDEIAGPKLISVMNEEGKFETPALHEMYPFLDSNEIESLML